VTICPSFPGVVPVCACSSVASGLVFVLEFSFFNEALLLMVALKLAGMGLVELYFVLLLCGMVSSSSV
jgi:hypothetical protein